MSEQPICIYCERDSDAVPLIAIQYQGKSLWICPQHLPILIHKPQQLEDKMPGLGSLPTVDHQH